MNLQEEIETLLSQGASKFEVAKRIRSEIQAYLRNLDSLFDMDRGKSFLVRHTRSIDQFVTIMYRYILRRYFGEFLPLSNTIPITIVALGSYGREQLCVHSDIDLLFVYKNTPGYRLNEILESILQLAWDAGLKLGHRVHEIDELLEASRSDHTIKTALLESRFVTGSKHLWYGVQQRLKIIANDAPDRFIREKCEEQRQRREKFDLNTMEPDIKSSPGGLRDFNTLFWIARVRFGVHRIKELPPHILSEEEYALLMRNVDFLYRIRTALHLVSGKKQDRLLFAYVPDVAHLFGSSQRRLLERVFAALRLIGYVTDLLIRRLVKPALFESTRLPLLKRERIAENVYRYDRTLLHRLDTPVPPLSALLEKLLSLPDTSEAFDIGWIALFFESGRHAPVVTSRCVPTIRRLFKRRHQHPLFLAFYRAGILDTLLPPLSKVRDQPQFDGYHTHPVDLHSIHTLGALENISDSFVSNLYRSLEPEERAILHIVALLHDCGKGRKKDHSELGASIVRSFLQELGYEERWCEIGSVLVRHHTLMSFIASREDIYNEKILYAFISKVRTPQIMKLLYILTYADITSVSKEAWSNFQARVMYRLYHLSLEAFENAHMIDEALKRALKERSLKKSSAFRTLPKLYQKKILSIESNLLFFKFYPEEIVTIARWIIDLKGAYAYKIHNIDHLQIEIIRKKEIHLGYLLSRLANLNVVNMDIFKFFDDVKYFRIDFLEKVEEEEFVYIKHYIDQAFSGEITIKLPPVDIEKEEIRIDCEHSRSYAQMQLATKDQRGLLANIITIFDDMGIDIASAKIQTIRKRTRNLFLIEKNGNFCSARGRIVTKLCQHTVLKG